MSRIKTDIRQFDWMIAGILMILVVFSLIGLWSASHQTDSVSSSGPQYHKLQLRWIGLSLVVCIALCVPHYTVFSRYAYSAYLVGIALLVMVKLFGITRFGAQRWLDLKFMDFQPSELMKIVIVLALARMLMYQERLHSMRSLLGPILLVAVPSLFILRQPDLGTALVFAPILFVMLFAAGAKRRHLVLFLCLGLITLPLAYHFVMKDYQKARILAFLHPEDYSKKESYQLIQSIDAIGSGKLFGKGLGQGTQNTLDFIPAKHNDFIFSVMGEEWGFVGCSLFLLMYLTFLLLCLGVGMRTREPFARLVTVGMSSMFAMQLMVNVGMTVGLMPITGMTLPFVSYGGSSLMSSMIAVAVLLNISIRQVYISKRLQADTAQDYTWKYDPQPMYKTTTVKAKVKG